MNINDVDPKDLSSTPPAEQAGPAASVSNINKIDPKDLQTEQQYKEEKYGSLPQQALAGLEGVGRGALGPIPTALQVSLGLSTPEDIRGRQEANPITHGLGEAAGFGGSMLATSGLGSLVSGIGKGAEALSGISKLAEAAPALSKIAASGIRTGAEMAALQTSDEISDAITNKPGQTIGNAAINIGLSGILGGAGGAALGSVSPLWNKAVNKIGAEKLASDFMGESKFLKENPDLIEGARQEINDRISSAEQLMGGGLKKELIDKIASDVTPDMVGKHVDFISKSLDSAPKALSESPSFKEAVEKWQNKVMLPTEEIPTSTANPYGTAVNEPQLANPSEVFKATENLKRELQQMSNYNAAMIQPSERPFINAARNMSSNLAKSLEDSKIWGTAGDVQKYYNKAISPLFDIQKEFLGKFASKELGEKVADPTKINTYLNQAEKGKAGLKTNYVNNYLDQTQKAADAINEAYHNHGMEMPLEERLNPTPVLNHSMGVEPSTGVNLARWANRGGAATMAARGTGEAASGAIGGGLGFLVGHPMIGAWMGEKVLAPVFSALAKPLAENAINSEAAKASVDYIGNVIKGDRALKSATSNLFKPGIEVLSRDLIPDQSSRDSLEKSLHYAGTSDNMMKVGGNIGHYLPDHGSAAASTASIAVQYLESLKPKQPVNMSMDNAMPVDKFAQAKYNRALDIAQQPLLAIKYAKDGTLLPQDVTTLNTIYPGLHEQIISSVGNELIQAKADGVTIPYKQKLGMSMLLGAPLDSTMTPEAMRSIMSSVSAKAAPQMAQNNSKAKPTEMALKQTDKANKMDATPLQERQIQKHA